MRRGRPAAAGGAVGPAGRAGSGLPQAGRVGPGRAGRSGAPGRAFPEPGRAVPSLRAALWVRIGVCASGPVPGSA